MCGACAARGGLEGCRDGKKNFFFFFLAVRAATRCGTTRDKQRVWCVCTKGGEGACRTCMKISFFFLAVRAASAAL
jgi:hypothetical protein